MVSTHSVAVKMKVSLWHCKLSAPPLCSRFYPLQPTAVSNPLYCVAAVSFTARLFLLAYKHVFIWLNLKPKHRSSLDPMAPYIYSLISLLPYMYQKLLEWAVNIDLFYFLFRSLLTHTNWTFFYHYTETGLSKVLNDTRLAKSNVLTPPSSACWLH